MSNFEISDFQLSRECDALARAIFDEVMAEHAGEDPEDYREDMDDRAHETADGHEWVIYNYKALMLCAHCDVSQGEEFLEDIGMPEEVTIHNLACTIAYGEMRARIMDEINNLIDAWDEEDTETSGDEEDDRDE